MNLTLNALNVLASRMGETVVAMLWQSSLVIAIIAVADWLLRRRVSAKFRHALWILVLVKLLLPPSLALPTSPVWWWPRIGGQFGLNGSEPELVEVSVAGEIRKHTEAATPGGDLSGTNDYTVGKLWPVVLFLLWSSGVVVLCVWIIRRWWWVLRIRKEAELAPSEIQQLADELAVARGFRKKIIVYVTRRFQTPAVCGLYRPFILLPANILEPLSGGGIRSVILHELTHIRRGDLWLNRLQTLLQVAWWFNPLIWLTNSRMRGLREEAVDEQVMSELVREGEDATVYPAALVEVAKLHLKGVGFGLAFVGIMDGQSALHGRIRRLVTMPDGWSPAGAPTIFAAVAIAGLIMLPMGCISKSKPVAVDQSRHFDYDAANRGRMLREVSRRVAQERDKSSRTNHDSTLHTRIFRVESRNIVSALDAIGGFPGSGSATNNPYSKPSIQLRIRNLFRMAGIDLTLPEDQGVGSDAKGRAQTHTMFYNDRSGFLFVRTTESELDSVEKLIQVVNITPPQVVIEGVFVEAKAGVLHRLMSEIFEGGGQSFVLNPKKMGALRLKLEATDGVDVLSAPRVTTMSGRAAEIQVVDLIPVVASESGATNTVPVGPILDVVAGVESDDTLIRLKIDAHLAMTLTHTDRTNGQVFRPTELAIRTATSDSVIHDGDTLVVRLKELPRAGFTTGENDSHHGLKDLAELIRRHPHPINSKNQSDILVFVTPRVIDPAGRPIHSLKEEMAPASRP